MNRPFLMDAGCIEDPTACPEKTRQVGDFDEPQWSSDGNLFAWCNIKDQYRPCDIDVNSLEITNLPLIPALMNITDDWVWRSWSPDRTKIAYEVDDTNNAGHRIGDIFIIKTAGGPTTNLTNSPEVDDRLHGWSPDGKYVLDFQVYGMESTINKHGVLNYHGDLFLYSIDGGNPIQLTHTPDEYKAFEFWLTVP